MTMVHNIEKGIISTLKEESPITAEHQIDLVNKMVERLHIEPGTSSDLIHSHLTAALAMHILESEGVVKMVRNGEVLELSLATNPAESAPTSAEVVPLHETAIEGLGVAATGAAIESLDLSEHTLAS
jgi:hypothetical protein